VRALVLAAGDEAVYGAAKNDLIAELKLSHTVGGVSKLRLEQARIAEQREREHLRKFLAQFTMENYLHKVSEVKCVMGHSWQMTRA
jgi:hypothetical protein